MAAATGIHQESPGVFTVKIAGRRFIKLTGAILGNAVLVDPSIVMAYVEATIYGSSDDRDKKENGIEVTRLLTTLHGNNSIDVLETPDQINEIYAQLEADNRKEIEEYMKKVQGSMQRQIVPAGPLIR